MDPCATLSPPVTENGEKQKDGMACSSAGAANDGSRGARPASGNRDDSDEEDISEKGSDSLEDDQESDDHDGRFGRLTGAAGKKRPRQELERHSAPSAPPTHVKREYSNSTADGAGTSTPARSELEYFPLSAGALRASLEVVPAKEMSSWRRLPPLLKLVTERQGDRDSQRPVSCFHPTIVCRPYLGCLDDDTICANLKICFLPLSRFAWIAECSGTC